MAGFLGGLNLCSFAQLEFRFPDLGNLEQEKPNLVGGIQRLRAVAVGSPVRYNRYSIGQQYGNIMQWSVGFNHLVGAPEELRVSGQPGKRDSTLRKYSLAFVNGEVLLIIARNEQWKVSVPTGLGIGYSTISDSDLKKPDEPIRKQGQFAPVCDLGLQATWYYLDWIGLSGGLGIRVVPSGKVLNLYTGPNYHFGIAFFPVVLYEKLTGKEFPSY
ncbi:MAG: hypothetical protein H6606_02600 [Flavobacteriales bacterium]|nr:hypothetical protein [Flavobacteriales bacterium]